MIQILENFRSKTQIISPKSSNKDKRLSLPVKQFLDPNRIFDGEKKFTISTIKEVISFSQIAKDSVGSIVINWVNK